MMKDPYGLMDSGLPPELVAQLMGAGSRQKIAEAMMASSMTPVENMGGPGAKVSWTQGLAKIADALVAGRDMANYDKVYADVARQADEGKRTAMDKFTQIQSGTPAKPMISDDFTGDPAMTQGTPGNMKAALEYASTNPYLAKNAVIAAQLKAWEKEQEPYILPKDATRNKGGTVIATNKGPIKPMVEHNFPLGSKDGVPMVQSHISLDEGKTWAPMPGSQPVPKFAPQRDPVDRPFFQAVPTTNGIGSFNARTGKLDIIAGPDGGPLVKPSDSPALQAQIAAGKKAGEEGAKANQAQYDAAQSAADNLGKINQLIDHLKSSEAITGLGAETLKNVERAKALITSSEKAGKKVSDTEILDVMMGSDVFPMIQSLGIGARGMDTPAERDYLRSVMTGTIPMNRETLIKMAEIRKNIAERAINRFNDRVTKGELDDWFKNAGRTKATFSGPAKPRKYNPQTQTLE